MNRHILEEVANCRMPFGKFKDKLLIQIPEEYFIWMKNNPGFPKGKLGELMAIMFEIKQNGLESLITPLISK